MCGGDGGARMRCSYSKCERPDESGRFVKIEGGRTSGGQDWSSLVGSVVCQACFERFRTRGTLERARVHGKQPTGSARRCTYDHCHNPTKGSSFHHIGEGQTAGGQDWSSVVGSVLCHACYENFRLKGTLERAGNGSVLADDAAPRHPKVRVAGIRAIEATPTPGGRLVKLPAALATHFNEAMEWPIDEMDDRDVEMLESIEAYDRGNYLVRWMTSEWPTGLPTKNMEKWLRWNKATVVVPYGIDEDWDEYKGGAWTMECCVARGQDAADTVLADVVKVGSDTQGQVVMGDTSEIFIDTDVGSITWCRENHEQPERVRADRWVKEEAMWAKATSSDESTRIQDLLRESWERTPIKSGETRRAQRERSRYTVACGEMRLSSTLGQGAAAKSQKTCPSRHSQVNQPPTSAQDLGNAGASYGGKIKLEIEPSPTLDHGAGAKSQNTSPLSRGNQPLTPAQDLGDTAASYGGKIKVKIEPPVSPTLHQGPVAKRQKTSPSRHCPRGNKPPTVALAQSDTRATPTCMVDFWDDDDEDGFEKALMQGNGHQE